MQNAKCKMQKKSNNNFEFYENIYRFIVFNFVHLPFYRM